MAQAHPQPSPLLVTVIGGDGFVGRYVVQALLRAGHRVRVACRSPKRAWYLKNQANLGQIGFAACDVTRAETLGPACDGADVVVNLAGSFANVDAVQHIGAGNVARAAAAAGARRLVHISAIGADRESASAYGRSKGDGEAAVRAAFPTATILRPSIIFGREDKFINRFAAMMRMMPLVPVLRGDAKFQPVYVGDVAAAVLAAVGGAGAGAVVELGGPQVMTMAEVQRWIASRTGRLPLFVDVPDFAGALLAKATGWLPAAPITTDQWLMLQCDNVVAKKAQTLSDLGVTPTPMDAVAPEWLVQYRRNGRFAGHAGA
jgi:NADH dehydrogenase